MELDQMQRPKLDGKDRLIQQLEGQRNNALTQSALFGAELESTREALAECEGNLELQKLSNKALRAELEALKPTLPEAAAETPLEVVAEIATGVEG